MRLLVPPILNLTLALLFVVAGVSAQEAKPSEYQLKAAFLFNFAKFIEWPPEAFAEKESPFIIGILGDNPFGKELERTILGKTVNGRMLEIRTFDSPAEAKKCHILFIGSSENKRLPEVLDNLHGTSVLTVSDWVHFTKNGGMINFVLESNRIRFRINDQAARGAGLKISSKLLNLAVPPAP
jgi:hypothetical protein